MARRGGCTPTTGRPALHASTPASAPAPASASWCSPPTRRIEHEWRQILGDLAGRRRSTKAASGTTPAITPETLRAMEARIADAPPRSSCPALPARRDRLRLHLGRDGHRRGARVRAASEAPAPRSRATTPITAAFAAFQAFGRRRIAVLTPYRDDVNQRLQRYIEARGFEVPVFGSFNEEDDHKVAASRRSPIRAAALDARPRTRRRRRLRLLHQPPPRRHRPPRSRRNSAKPVTSSNHAMAWHALRLAGIDDSLPRLGPPLRARARAESTSPCSARTAPFSFVARAILPGAFRVLRGIDRNRENRRCASRLLGLLAASVSVLALSLGGAALKAEDYGPFKAEKTKWGRCWSRPKGMTLYTFDKDKDGKSACTRQVRGLLAAGHGDARPTSPWATSASSSATTARCSGPMTASPSTSSSRTRKRAR